jgi:hypothetical protein
MADFGIGGVEVSGSITTMLGKGKFVLVFN